VQISPASSLITSTTFLACEKACDGVNQFPVAAKAAVAAQHVQKPRRERCIVVRSFMLTSSAGNKKLLITA
jgi:hypothetical protein